MIVNYSYVTAPKSRGQLADERLEASSPIVQQDVPEGYVNIGGVLRKAADIMPAAPVPQEEVASRIAELAQLVGQVPRIDISTNASTKIVAKAAEEGDLTRLSTMASIPAFDADEYLANREAYLEDIVPARIWQSSGDKSAKKIIRKNYFYNDMLQGETIELKVEVAPRSPVTFHSNNLGQFPNKLTTMTVESNEEGLAVIPFLATQGTYGEIDILAASPSRRNRAHFVVNVKLPGLGLPTTE